MGIQQDRLLCLDCGKPTLHSRPHFSGGIGCILTVLTGCIFLPIWVLILVVQSFQPMRCQTCGLTYSASAANAHMRRLARARAAAQPAKPTAPSEPPFDWDALRWTMFSACTATTAAIEGFCRMIAREIVRGYRSLPDWAAPIIWGLGFTSPIIIMVAVGRYFGWW
jgi:hypothetical protein